LNAGTNKSKDCRLFLTEGLSASAFVKAGIDIIGRNNYGVFPLKGKPVNVSELTDIKGLKKLESNEEFTSIKKILGLKQDCKYATEKERSTLRYGGIVIAAD
tara:strand:+ start:1526 stop:1831 length:306 start_codon:yes stop_codon:yes gene_type:complete